MLISQCGQNVEAVKLRIAVVGRGNWQLKTSSIRILVVKTLYTIVETVNGNSYVYEQSQSYTKNDING